MDHYIRSYEHAVDAFDAMHQATSELLDLIWSLYSDANRPGRATGWFSKPGGPEDWDDGPPPTLGNELQRAGDALEFAHVAMRRFKTELVDGCDGIAIWKELAEPSTHHLIAEIARQVFLAIENHCGNGEPRHGFSPDTMFRPMLCFPEIINEHLPDARRGVRSLPALTVGDMTKLRAMLKREHAIGRRGIEPLEGRMQTVVVTTKLKPPAQQALPSPEKIKATRYKRPDCPKCGNKKTRVMKTGRPDRDGKKTREVRCDPCKHNFTDTK